MNLDRRLLICTCISLSGAFYSHGQTAQGDSVDRPVTRILLDDLGIAYRDATGFFTAPFSFDATDWNRFAVGTVAIGAVMAMDEPLNSLMVANPYPDFLAKPFEWGKHGGTCARCSTRHWGSISAGWFRATTASG